MGATFSALWEGAGLGRSNSSPCYASREMFTVLGRVLAILAVMASAVNAQCALSCSLKLSQPHRIAAAGLARTGHACCARSTLPFHQEAPTPTQPCSPAAPAVAEVELPAPLELTSALHFLTECFAPLLDYASLVARIGLLIQFRLPHLPDAPAFSILRV